MCGSSKSGIWVLERELRKAFNCSSTNAGVPDVGAIGRLLRLVALPQGASESILVSSGGPSCEGLPGVPCWSYVHKGE
jgi:hypothetical protein